MTHVKPLLVGETNPYGDNPEFALYPSPVGCSGHRLCHLIMGFEDSDEYLERFDRVNLCVGKWSMKSARERADTLRVEYRGATKVLLGSKVCSAFGARFEPFTIVEDFVILPHPSGLNRLWQEPARFGLQAFDRARAILQKAGVL